ncbi:DUF1642 domain-containing protein [Enterococcus faecium]|uniref:DUF1642 domain-containing protein n=1 Tax=Enterococcus faecium TaxID=1352 RepID=UPI001E46AC11|nr:DUF1642 domain-containing protein [Enterococcus faecium]MCD5175131.1 DUF1642 domain-containing protein [Enterococcus faecium]
MNKQELINKLARLVGSMEDFKGITDFHDGKYAGLEHALELIKKLDEPQKPVVPQFVAEWIELCKEKADLISCLSGSYEYGVNQYKTITEDEDWLFESDHQEIVARAWLDGYEVEKEQVWVIKNAVGNYLTICSLWGKDGVNYSFECNPSHRLLFTDKSIADAAALLVNGTVEEEAEG